MKTADKAAQQRKKAERRRSHINDPAPQKWTLRNMWVIGQHLPIDWGVVVCTIILTLLGSLMVLSASSYTMSVKGEDALGEFKTQLFGMAVGGVGFFFAMHLDYRWLKQRWVVMALCGACAVMLGLVVLLPKLGSVASFFNDGHFFLIRSPYVNNAYRWLYFGPPGHTWLSIQPAEILKVAVVLYLSYYMDKKQKTMHLFWRNNFAALFTVGLLILEVLAQPNLSTSCLLVFVTLFLLMAGLSNAVNLTDGLDGLAGGCTMVVMLFMAMVAFLYNELDLAILAGAIAGACVGFLWHNCYPASIFMGDTGSLALGAALASLAVLTKTEVTSLIMGGVFVCEALSVMIQVTSFKLTGKRVFLMTPIHHHFEQMGWAENKVVIRFWIVTAAFASLGFALYFQLG